MRSGPIGLQSIIRARCADPDVTAAVNHHVIITAAAKYQILGTDGSVAYLFSKQGIISYGPDVAEDSLLEAALEAGAEDLEAQEDDSFEIVTLPEEFLDVKDALVASGFKPDNAEVTMVPATRVELGRDGAETILKLIDMLEDLDDVQNVYHNAEISDELMAEHG